MEKQHLITLVIVALLFTIVLTYVINSIVQASKVMNKDKSILYSVQINVLKASPDEIIEIEKYFVKNNKKRCPNYNDIITPEKCYFSCYSSDAFNHQYYIGYKVDNKIEVTPQQFFYLINE